MAEQTRKQRTPETRKTDPAEQAAAEDTQAAIGATATNGAVRESGEKLKTELEDLLDEIDEVLETNAEDFVRAYVQKGGE